MTEQIKVKPLIIKIRIHKTPLCKQNYDVKCKLSMIHLLASTATLTLNSTLIKSN